jgi:hypothetical protein
MAFTQMSTTYYQPIYSLQKSLQDKPDIYPACAHNPDNPDIRGILVS